MPPASGLRRYSSRNSYDFRRCLGEEGGPQQQGSTKESLRKKLLVTAARARAFLSSTVVDNGVPKQILAMLTGYKNARSKGI